MCQQCSLLSPWEAKYVWVGHNFLGGRWELETFTAVETEVAPRQLMEVKLGRRDAVPGRSWTNPDAWLDKESRVVGKGQEVRKKEAMV